MDRESLERGSGESIPRGEPPKSNRTESGHGSARLASLFQKTTGKQLRLIEEQSQEDEKVCRERIDLSVLRNGGIPSGVIEEIGVKEESWKAVVSPQAVINSAFAVGAVSDHLMTETCEVPADLMPSPCFDSGFKQAEAIFSHDLAKVGQGRDRGFFLFSREWQVTFKFEGCVASDQYKLTLDGLRGLDQRLQPGCGLRTHSHTHDSRGSPVDSMNGVDELTDSIANPCQKRLSAASLLIGRVNEHTRRLACIDLSLIHI